MGQHESLKHTVCECTYHVMWIPKYRKKAIYGELRRELARQKESSIEAGHLLPDHMHIVVTIPPKYSVAQVVGYIKGKGAIHRAWTHMNRRKHFIGENFWARGYYVLTVGKDEEAVRQYIQQQEAEDPRIEQLKLFA